MPVPIPSLHRIDAPAYIARTANTVLRPVMRYLFLIVFPGSLLDGYVFRERRGVRFLPAMAGCWCMFRGVASQQVETSGLTQA